MDGDWLEKKNSLVEMSWYRPSWIIKLKQFSVMRPGDVTTPDEWYDRPPRRSRRNSRGPDISKSRSRSYAHMAGNLGARIYLESFHPSDK
jgi:hypothetical protein